MRILVANDDGITAPGIAVLREALMPLGTVTVVAPETEMSAVGHAITLTTPLRVRRVETADGDFFGYAVNGTPADCVKIAVRELMKENPPDLVVSGVNQGPNVATNVIYSGTVSAATEGVILGIPGVAVSMASFTRSDFSVAARYARLIAQRVAEEGLPEGVLINVNVPAVDGDDIVGVKVCRMGESKFREAFDKRVDPRMADYYWQGGGMVIADADHDADIVWLEKNYVTVTPIHFDLTRHDLLDRIAGWDF